MCIIIRNRRVDIQTQAYITLLLSFGNIYMENYNNNSLQTASFSGQTFFCCEIDFPEKLMESLSFREYKEEGRNQFRLTYIETDALIISPGVSQKETVRLKRGTVFD